MCLSKRFRNSLLACFLFYTGTVMAQATGVHISFVQTVNNAKLLANSGQANQYTLTLYGVNPYITYYFDRPSRSTGLATIKGFVAAWDVGSNSFAVNNPNAILYAGEVNGQNNLGQTAYVVQLSNPRYDLVQNQMTYSVTPLGKEGFILNELDLTDAVLVIN